VQPFVTPWRPHAKSPTLNWLLTTTSYRMMPLTSSQPDIEVLRTGTGFNGVRGIRHQGWGGGMPDEAAAQHVLLRLRSGGVHGILDYIPLTFLIVAGAEHGESLVVRVLGSQPDAFRAPGPDSPPDQHLSQAFFGLAAWGPRSLSAYFGAYSRTSWGSTHCEFHTGRPSPRRYRSRSCWVCSMVSKVYECLGTG
jgi:hypothetical protein